MSRICVEFDSAKPNLFSFDQSKEEESIFRTFSVVPLQSNMNLLKIFRIIRYMFVKTFNTRFSENEIFCKKFDEFDEFDESPFEASKSNVLSLIFLINLIKFIKMAYLLK